MLPLPLVYFTKRLLDQVLACQYSPNYAADPPNKRLPTDRRTLALWEWVEPLALGGDSSPCSVKGQGEVSWDLTSALADALHSGGEGASVNSAYLGQSYGHREPNGSTLTVCV